MLIHRLIKPSKSVTGYRAREIQFENFYRIMHESNARLELLIKNVNDKKLLTIFATI